ncbi:MAG: response regulator transcription factor [Bryobacterales bacterium]
MAKPRIIVAEDHKLVADGIRALVSDEFELIGVVDNGLELVERCEKERPDLALADISMPMLNGLDALREIKKKGLRTKVVIVTGSADVGIATGAFRAGARGFVLKHAASEELLTALREAHMGRTFITPRIANDVLQRLMEDPDDDGEIDLTPRERQVLQLIAEGNSSKEAAAILDVAARTIEFHKRNIMEKTGLHTTAELARFASKIGLVADPMSYTE